MSATIAALAIAYAVTTALLVNLNLNSIYSPWLKTAAVVLVSVLYLVTWRAANDLLGWATPAALPENFRLHWITIDEPDKVVGTPGTIYFWLRPLDDAGLPIGEPRAHRVPWDEDTAQAAEDALAELEGGTPLNGRMSRQVVNPDELPEDERPQYDDAGSVTHGEQPSFEFVRVPPPALPPKAIPPS